MISSWWWWLSCEARLEHGDGLGQPAPALRGPVVVAAGQADQHPVVLEHDLRDSQRELGVSVPGAVGDRERELGDPVEVATPPAAGAAQDQSVTASSAGTD